VPKVIEIDTLRGRSTIRVPADEVRSLNKVHKKGHGQGHTPLAPKVPTTLLSICAYTQTKCKSKIAGDKYGKRPKKQASVATLQVLFSTIWLASFTRIDKLLPPLSVDISEEGLRNGCHQSFNYHTCQPT